MSDGESNVPARSGLRMSRLGFVLWLLSPVVVVAILWLIIKCSSPPPLQVEPLQPRPASGSAG